MSPAGRHRLRQSLAAVAGTLLMTACSTVGPPTHGGLERDRTAAEAPRLVFQEEATFTVSVTDAQDRHVENLTPKDVNVLADDEPAEISVFDEVRDGPITLTIYVDQASVSTDRWVDRVRELRSWLRRSFRPGDWVRILSSDQVSEIPVPFSWDFAELDSRLQALEDEIPRGPDYLPDLRSFIEAAEDDSTQTELLIEPAYRLAKTAADESERSIQTLRRVIEGLAGLPRTQALIWLSNGVTVEPGREALQALYNRTGESRHRAEILRYSQERRLEFLGSIAGTAGVTIHALSPSDSDRRPGLEGQNRQATLLALTQATGGLAVIDTDRFTAGLDSIEQRTRSYYRIGLKAPAETNRFYVLEFEIIDSSPAISVHLPAGFRALDLPTRLDRLVRAAQVFGYREDALGLSLSAERLRAQEDGVITTLWVNVPIASLPPPYQGPAHQDRLEYRLVARTSDGKISPSKRLRIPLEDWQQPVNDLQQASYKHPSTILTREGRCEFVVLVRDAISGRIGIASLTVEVEKA